MVLHKVWLVPVASSGIAIASYFVCYAIALANNHVDAFLPYISDTGTLPPESCVFGQLLNLSALFLILSVYLRHRQIVEYYGHRLKMNGRGRWRRVSTFLLCLGYLSALGKSVVANFQETNVLIVHDIAAFTMFFATLAYCWGHVLFSYVMKPRMSGLHLSHARLVLSIASTVLLLLHMITMFVEPFVTSTVENANMTTTTQATQIGYSIERYKPGAPEYTNHLVVTTAEWLLVLSFELFILSFAIEFRHAYVHAPKLIIKPGQHHIDNGSQTIKVSYISPDESVNSLQTTSDTTLTSR